MNKLSCQTRRIILGTVLVGCLGTSTIFAGSVQKQIKAVCDSGIRVTLDGKEVELKDPNGDGVTPILYNGTTYLPVRAVSNALGLSVNWNDKNRNVELKSPTAKKETQENTVPYQIVEQTYTDKGVKIKFPSIVNLVDAEKQKNINLLIKDSATAIYKRTLNGLDSSSKYEADVSYEIKLKSDKLLSIAFSSYNNIVPSAHPYYLFHTINIDLEKGTELKLKDISPKIDEKFVKALKNAKYVGQFASDPVAVKEAVSYTFGELSDKELIKIITDESNQRDVYGYLTKDGLGISISVGHAMGDHAEFEISNSELEAKQNANPKTDDLKQIDKKFETYINGRYGFSIKYPKSWTISEEPPSGDGVVLYNKDKNDIRVYGGYLLGDKIDRMEVNEAKNKGIKVDEFVTDNGEKGYKILENNGDRVILHVVVYGSKMHCHLYADTTKAFYKENELILIDMAKSIDLGK